ncbi:interleukin-1 beta-like [Gouania willdenowi]|uniref:Interleukin-1 n=1 Tax=Gouania willdenowi TaxID=441366 RepID=A0A8C5H486_GOUWI|nr:interleukin-1 beta-like [Gouania willdenowi]XP_028314254.1 interleukin-1 beta-like [Gouania willdenowi]
MGSLKRCNSNSSNTWSHKMPEGVDLEISHHPLTMKKVAHLIIAMERLKGSRSRSVLRTDFRDQNLLSIMLDGFMEVYETYSAPPPHFRRTGVHTCSVMDSEKRNLVLVKDSMELHAVLLQGGSGKRKVHLNMSTYVHPMPPVDARPVVLGIKDTNLYLSCHLEGDEPTLHLEEVEDKSSLSRISDDSEMLRFLFYKQDTGVNNSTLMSACYPDWYISTAEEDNKAVIMSQEASSCYQTFNIQRESYTDATYP